MFLYIVQNVFMCLVKSMTLLAMITRSVATVFTGSSLPNICCLLWSSSTRVHYTGSRVNTTVIIVIVVRF